MAAVVRADVERLIRKAIDECEAGWRPRLEAVTLQLEAERRRHDRFLALSTSVADGDQRLISTLQRRIFELEDVNRSLHQQLLAAKVSELRVTA